MDKYLLRRYLLFCVSLFVNALGIAFITKASLGTSPITSVTYVLSIIGISVILGIGIWFALPYYQELSHMHTCTQEGHTKSWCQQVWLELSKLD